MIAVIIAAGALIGYKMWNQPFRDPAKGEAINVTAEKLFTDFNTDEAAARKQYVPETLGSKVVQVTGEVKEIGKNESGESYYYLKTSN